MAPINELAKVCIVCGREFPKDIHDCPDDLVRLSDKDPLLGTIFDGKFEVLDFIGIGGLGRVYKARHIELNRIYALKILKSSEIVDLQRFRREAISIGQLSHPNIAQVYAFSISPDSRPYMVLEFLDGKDLADRLARDGALSVAEAIPIFVQVASALAHAHSRGVIHRDIKPGNFIILSTPFENEEVKVVDFGMAKLTFEETLSSQKITLEGEVFGTKQYIAPEQYMGDPADARSDIFSLGVSIREAVSSADGKVPELLAPLISKATQIKKEKRYQSVDDLLKELNQIQDSLGAASGSGDLSSIQIRGTEISSTIYLTAMLLALILVGSLAAYYFVRKEILTMDNSSILSASPQRRLSPPVSYQATESQADDLMWKGKVDAATQLLTDWINIHKSNSPAENVISVYKKLIACFLESGRTKEARKYGQEAIAFLEGKKALEQSTAELYIILSRVENNAGSVERSRVDALKAVEILEKEKVTSGYLRCIAYDAVAQTYLTEDKYGEAEKWARQAVLSYRAEYGVDGRSNTAMMETLATALYGQGKIKESMEFLENAILFREQNRLSEEIFYLKDLSIRAERNIKLDLRDLIAKDYDVVARNFPVGNIHQSTRKEVAARMERLATYLGRKTDQARWRNAQQN